MTTGARLPSRLLPELTIENEFFWTSGADGVLRVARCQDCGFYAHPPSPRCPGCLSQRVHPEAVSGRATVEAVTINVEPWEPDDEVPYVVAIVSLAEDPLVRLTTNVVECDPKDVRIGMTVEVTFEARAGIHLPLFRPVRESV